MKNTLIFTGIFMAFAGSLCFCSAKEYDNQYDVAAIVWPAYHPEPRWKELGIFSHGNGEWQNVYEAVSKKEGDNQPLVPLWGYEPEDNPVVVARKIDAALAAGINVFMYDWYWYQGRPFLEGALNNGFLKAPNNERMKFFLMWANHDVNSLWNNKVKSPEKYKTIWSADVSFEEFTKVLVPRFIEYFKKPNYYKIDNKPLFAIFEFNNMIRGIGSAEKTKQALDFLREECKKAGFDGLHLMSMAWYGPAKGIVPGIKNPTHSDIAKYYGFDSMSTYNMRGKRDNYQTWVDTSIAEWEQFKKEYGIFFPIVSTGWDTNPRYPQGEFQPIVEGKSPASYEKALRKAKAWADENIPADKPKLIIINAWNEWTEGEYLEPDKHYGYDYLNATARVFGAHGQSKQ